MNRHGQERKLKPDSRKGTWEAMVVPQQMKAKLPW